MVSWKLFTATAPSLDVPGLETVDLADKDMERRIVRKQDLRILPWICVTYLLSEHVCPMLRHPSNKDQITSTESTWAMPEPSTMTRRRTTSSRS